MLSKYERNEIFELIQQSELDLADFDPPQEDGAGRTRIHHLPTGSSLAVNDAGQDVDGFRGFSLDGESHQKYGSELEDIVAFWLARVAGVMAEIERDRNTPDLWAEFSRERDALNGSVPTQAANTPFTPAEQAELETRLGEIAKYAAETGKFDDDELRFLNAKLDYLIESSKHSRRFDWREQMVGAFLSAAVGNVLPQGATMDVLNTIVSTVGHLIGHPVLGLPR